MIPPGIFALTVDLKFSGGLEKFKVWRGSRKGSFEQGQDNGWEGLP